MSAMQTKLKATQFKRCGDCSPHNWNWCMETGQCHDGLHRELAERMERERGVLAAQAEAKRGKAFVVLGTESFERRRVLDGQVSICPTAALEDLDFTTWIFEGGGDSEASCLRVRDGRDGTWHRVFCRVGGVERLMEVSGRLYWLVARPQTENTEDGDL